MSENRTADPSFLAQFNDEQLQEYLAHLKWLRQPRLSGNPGRFEKYFRSPAAGPARTTTGRWKTDAARHQAQDEEGDPSASTAAPPAEPAPQQHAIQMPAESAFDELVLPPAEQPRVDEAPSDEESLDQMQVTPQERQHLREPNEGSEAPGKSETDDQQPPFAESDPDAQPWMF